MREAWRKRSRRSEVPTSSMADIAFLLIIFFMVTTVFSATKGLQLALPTEEGEVEVEAVHIEIQASGRLTVDDQPMSMTDLEAYLMPKLAVNPDKPVIVQTAPDAGYGRMVDVLDELKKAGARSISLPIREDVSHWTAD